MDDVLVFAGRGVAIAEGELQLVELQAALGLRPFTVPEYRRLRGRLTDLALRTHKPVALPSS